MPEPFASRFVTIDGIRTHYLEAGDGPVVVLLHSGEFGACAELSWERNIAALARSFRVLAPDWLGYGQTDKLFDFEDMWMARVRHIAAFLRVLNVERAHFVGNSMGGSVLITVAALMDHVWPMDRIVVVSGGGAQPQSEARAILNDYDRSREHMRRIVEVVFVDPSIRADEDYIERRYRESLRPGAWECTAAARFRAPGRASDALKRPAGYSTIRRKTLLIAGAADTLRDPGYAEPIQQQIVGSELVVVEGAGHCPHIEKPDLFNAICIDFLLRPSEEARGMP